MRAQASQLASYSLGASSPCPPAWPCAHAPRLALPCSSGACSWLAAWLVCLQLALPARPCPARSTCRCDLLPAAHAVAPAVRPAPPLLQERDGKPETVQARYTYIYKLVDGEWKVRRHRRRRAGRGANHAWAAMGGRRRAPAALLLTRLPPRPPHPPTRCRSPSTTPAPCPRRFKRLQAPTSSMATRASSSHTRRAAAAEKHPRPTPSLQFVPLVDSSSATLLR